MALNRTAATRELLHHSRALASQRALHAAGWQRARGAIDYNSDSDAVDEEGDMNAESSYAPIPAPGPVEKKLRKYPAPVGLCFGTYGEGSEGVHILVDRIAHKLAEERGEELGCDKEKVLGLFKQRTRCALGVAAVRARAVARAARMPLVGCTTVQANRLLAGSCSSPPHPPPGPNPSGH